MSTHSRLSATTVPFALAVFWQHSRRRGAVAWRACMTLCAMCLLLLPWLVQAQTKPPAAPTGVSGTWTGNTVTLTWNPVSGATKYKVLRTTTSFRYANATVYTTAATATTLAIRGTVGTRYYYVVRALNSNGESVNSSQITFLCLPTPTNFSARWGTNKATLKWDAVTGAVRYLVYRRDAGKAFNFGTPLATVTKPTYTNTGLANNTYYVYTVTAGNQGGMSPSATEQGVTPLAAPTLKVASASAGVINLKWTAVYRASSYKVFRRTNGGTFPGTPNAIISGTTYSDTNLSSSTTYQYTVRGLNATGETANSNIVSAAPQSPVLTVSGASVAEGNSGLTPLTFIVRLSTASTKSVSFNYATAAGSATANEDFVQTTGSIIIPAGQSYALVTISVNGDATVESDETFRLVVSGISGARLSSGTSVSTTGTIVNDDVAATATPIPSATPVPTNTSVPSVTATPVPTATATSTPMPTATPTGTPTGTATPGPTPTETPVPTATAIPTSTPTPAPTATTTPVPTSTPTPVPTSTPTSAPTATPVPTSTPTTAPTATSTPAPTATPAPTSTPTTAPTATSTPAPTATPVPTATPSAQTIVELALAYRDTLSTAQKSATVVSATATYAVKWSNLPATPSSDGTESSGRRNGVSYSSLTTTAQKTAWLALVQAALSADSSNDYNQFNQIRASDNYLGTLTGGYSGDYQYVAFVGTPSTSGTWMLQVGGHHNAHNYYYNGNTLKTSTPYFLGVEPTSFSYNGTAYTPMETQRSGMYNMINSLTSTQLASAKLSSSFSDVYLGPGKDARSNFPTGTTGRGILASNLTSAQQTLVNTAIAAYANNSPLATAYKSLYASEINQTYVAYSGTTTFNSQGDYVRIDGPHVWIEFVCQNGIVIPSQIHYHSVWRDRLTDYNADYGFTTSAASPSTNSTASPSKSSSGLSSSSATFVNYQVDSASPTQRAVMAVANTITNAARRVLELVCQFHLM